MRVFLLLSALTAILLCPHLRLAAQDIDSIVTSASRTSATIADGIKDPAERSAFITISKTNDPQKLLALTRSFLEKYPRSAFLAQVAEGAARSSFDLGDLKSGMDYAKFSLSLLPENPLLAGCGRRCPGSSPPERSSHGQRPRCSRLPGSI